MTRTIHEKAVAEVKESMKLNKSLAGTQLTTLGIEGIQAIPLNSKPSGYVLIDREKKKAIIHCGTHGQIYLPLKKLWDVLEETMDILVHFDC